MGDHLLNKKLLIIFLILLFGQKQIVYAQCNNADFEDGTLNGWLGTYGDGSCTGTLNSGGCSSCYTPDPYQHSNLNIGPNNQPANGPAGFNHFIMTSGYDPIAGGTNLPVVYAPGTYSVRLGDAHANDAGHGGGESIRYRFQVTPNNSCFIYHYAAVLKDGGHVSGQQPYFKIGMVDGNNQPITCATYDVDATTAQTIGGFVTVGPISYKTWSTVLIPLNNYIGQTVTIQFTTRDCAPNGCEGSHWAYAYIDAECTALQVASTSPTICTGQTITLTAPAGVASYSWVGPGIVSGANAQQCQVNKPGVYTVNMTTFGTVPCNFTLTTTVIADPNALAANFTPTSLCAGVPTSFTDISTPAGSATTWAWDFNNDGITDATTQNPSHTFATAGTYPVRLRVGSPPCMDDTLMNVVVNAIPTATFNATSPVCAGANAAITYTGTASSSGIYNWDFSGGTIVSGAGQGPYQVSWNTSGVKNISLSTSANGCTSSLTTLPVTVNALPVVNASPNVVICAGANTIISASGATTYNWAPLSGLSATSGASITAAPVSTTTYSVTGTSLGCSDSASVTVTVNPLPVVTVSPDIAVCAGTSVTLVANGASAYSWAPASGLTNASAASINVTPIATTTYAVTGTSLGCSDSASVTVTVKSIPASSFVTSAPVCEGANATITYSGTALSSANYNWNFVGGTVASGTGQGPYQVNWATAGVKNVTLTVVSNGCSSASTTVPVTINPIPVVAVSPDVAICAGGNTTLTATGATAYNWTPVNGLNSSSNASVLASPAVTTTYSVTGTSLGCSSSASVTVSVKPIPSAAFTTTSPVCAGANSAITYAGNAPTGSTFNWNFDGGTITAGSGQGPYNVKWTTGGTKNISLTVTTNGCSSPVTTVPVTVNALPVVAVSSNVAICAGSSTTLTASGAAAYNWAPATGLSSSSGASISVTPISTTTYAVTGTTAGCSDSASVTVNVKAIPSSVFTTTSPVCAGANAVVTYTGTALINGTYTWNFDGGIISTGNGPGPYAINWSNAGVKNISLTVVSNGCPSPITTVPVTVNALPVITIDPITPICSGESTTLNATGANAYSWSPSGSLSSNSGGSVTATPANTTTYSVTGTSLGCSGTASAIVNVTPMPVAGFTAPTGQCVNGNHFNYQASGTFLPNATFNWNFGSDATPATSTAQNQQVTFGAPGTHPVSLTITQNGCVSNVFTDNTTIYPMPVAGFAADTALGCQNLGVCFTDNSTGAGGLTYAWNFGDGQSSSAQNPCHTYANAGNFTVKLQVTSANGCKDDLVLADMISVVANPIASFTVTGTTIQLPATNVGLQNTSSHSVSYLWLLGDSAKSSLEEPGDATFTTPGNYAITLYAYNSLGCVDTAQRAVTVYQEEVLYAPNAFTPNGDGNNDYFEIFGKKDGWKQIQILIFDRWGEKVFESNDMNFKWDGVYKGELMQPGVYVYLLRIVYTNNHADKLHKGSLTLIR